MGAYIKNKKTLKCQIEDKSENNEVIGGGGNDTQPTMMGRNILKHIKTGVNDVTTFNVQDGDNIVEIKTNDFHHLVKKFAISMFTKMKINMKTETLGK